MLDDDREDLDDDDMSYNTNDLIDNADAKDADIFEMLGEFNCPAMSIPEQAASDSPPGPVLPLCSAGQSEVANLEASPLAIIHLFPYGSPGTPISQDLHMEGTDSKPSNGSIWAPFGSQCDWEVAYWAKMRGPTSSATADLLAIPEVGLFFFGSGTILMCNERLFRGLNCLTAQLRN